MNYERKRITGFIAAIGVAGAAATAAAQTTTAPLGAETEPGVMNPDAMEQDASAIAQNPDLFDSYDVDRDMQVSEDEFYSGVERDRARFTSAPMSDDDMAGEDFSAFDTNRDAMLDEEEYEATGVDADFSALDADSDAMISEDEYYAGIQATRSGDLYPAGADGDDRTEVPHYNFSEFDVDDDDMLSEEEYATFLGETGGSGEFADFDRDSDRMLTRPEFYRGIQYSAGGVDMYPAGADGDDRTEVAHYDFVDFDADESGYLDEAEFTAYDERRMQDETTSLFQRMDENENGAVSELEFNEYVRGNYPTVSGADGDPIGVGAPQFAQFDDDGDGFLQPDEMDGVATALNRM